METLWSTSLRWDVHRRLLRWFPTKTHGQMTSRKQPSLDKDDESGVWRRKPWNAECLDKTEELSSGLREMFSTLNVLEIPGLD